MVEKAAAKTGVEKRRQARALVFELETLTANGRQLLFDAIKRALADKDVPIKPFQYSRFVLDKPLKAGVLELIKRAEKPGRIVEEKLLETVSSDYAAAVTGARRKIAPEMEKLLRKAADKGARLGAVTGLPLEAAQQLLKTVGIEDLQVSVFHYNAESKGFPTADSWLKLAKQIAVTPPLCMAVATSMKAIKGAVSAGMRGVAILDEFTRWQDFGGSDVVVDEMSALPIDRVLELLES